MTFSKNLKGRHKFDRYKPRWEHNIKINFTEVPLCANGFQMTHPKLRQAIVNKVINVRIPQKAENFLASWLSNPEDGVCPMKLILNSCTEATMNPSRSFGL